MLINLILKFFKFYEIKSQNSLTDIDIRIYNMNEIVYSHFIKKHLNILILPLLSYILKLELKKHYFNNIDSLTNKTEYKIKLVSTLLFWSRRGTGWMQTLFLHEITINTVNDDLVIELFVKKLLEELYSTAEKYEIDELEILCLSIKLIIDINI